LLELDLLELDLLELDLLDDDLPRPSPPTMPTEAKSPMVNALFFVLVEHAKE
jgi:hypothetical protein